MWQQEFIWFFTIFHQEFRKNNPIAFEVLMVLAVAHLFGFYNPKQLADFLEVPHQQFYTELKDWSVLACCDLVRTKRTLISLQLFVAWQTKRRRGLRPS